MSVNNVKRAINAYNGVKPRTSMLPENYFVAPTEKGAVAGFGWRF